jgi:UDP-glucose 4-epimerase
MILITGGAGYIGEQVVSQIKEDPEFQDELVVIFDSLEGRFDYEGKDGKGRRVIENLERNYRKIWLVPFDIRDLDIPLKMYASSADYVIHLACRTGAENSEENEELYRSTIKHGTEKVLDYSRRDGLKKFINISTCNVYGEAESESLTEESEVEPANNYAKFKYEAEQYVREKSEKYGIPAVSLRLSTNFGRGRYGKATRNNIVVNKFVEQAMNDNPVTPYGEGENWRPFLHVEDTARIITKMMKKETEPGEVFNVGFNDMNYKVREVAEKVQEVVEDKDVNISHQRDRQPDLSYNLNFDKLHNFMNIQKEYGLEEGIQTLVKNYD